MLFGSRIKSRGGEGKLGEAVLLVGKVPRVMPGLWADVLCWGTDFRGDPMESRFAVGELAFRLI